MSNIINVLIADDNVALGEMLVKFMNQLEDIRVIGVARDGFQALEMINALLPDVVVLDIVMPNLDGIGVLERFSSMKLQYRPIFIVLSAIKQDLLIQKIISLGAEYYLLKPFDINVLVSRIRQIYKERKSNQYNFNDKISVEKSNYSDDTENSIRRALEIKVTNLIQCAGVPPHLPGYRYLREAVIQALCDKSMVLNPITKVLYPSIAKKFNTTPQRVERAIRNAIESAWIKSGSRNTNFNAEFLKGKQKPTNSKFIAMLIEKIRISM